MKQTEVTKHFNKIAKDYDTYKKNHFYYTSVVKWELGKKIPKEKRILDYGCGTGEILNYLAPSYGAGYDLSPKMIQIARKKFKSRKNLTFTGSLKKNLGTFDYIITVDTLEHFADPVTEFKKMKKLMNKNTKLVVSYVGPSWSLLIDILGKLKPKTPEGPHKRITRDEVVKAARKAGLKLVSSPFLFSPISVFVFQRKVPKVVPD